MTKSKQGGGTFLGIILGVLAGLAVALGVAIYVAKVPVPFVNKNTTRSSGQDAAEAQRNRDWDPNATLRSRNDAPSGGAGGSVVPAPAPAPIPAPTDTARASEQPAVPPPAEVKPAEPRVAATKADDSRSAAAKPPARTPPTEAPTAEAPTPSTDPLGDFAAARASARQPAPAAADPFTYFVQAGAFRAPNDAEAQRARLSLMGVEARVTEREQSGRTIYRVRVGPFQNKDAADRVKDRLDDNGFDSALVRVQR